MSLFNRSCIKVPYRKEVSPKQAFRLATAVRRENTDDSPIGSAGSAPAACRRRLCAAVDGEGVTCDEGAFGG